MFASRGSYQSLADGIDIIAQIYATYRVAEEPVLDELLGIITEKAFSQVAGDEDGENGRNALMNQYFGLLNAVAGNSPALFFSARNRPQFGSFLGVLRYGVSEVPLITVNKVCVSSYHKLAAALFPPQGNVPEEVGILGNSDVGERDVSPTCHRRGASALLRILSPAAVQSSRSAVHHHHQ